MKIEFDTETIRLINLFENLTQTNIKDCLIDRSTNTVYFVVEENEAAMAIGKNGSKIKIIEKLINRRIKVFEYSKDLKKFVKNLIPSAINIEIQNGEEPIVIVNVDKIEKSVVIGRDERNLKIYKKLLERNHKVKNLIIR